jgi:hypothetical protein
MTSYVKPEIRDYGSLRELTEAVDFSGVEDGGNKLVGPHHT